MLEISFIHFIPMNDQSIIHLDQYEIVCMKEISVLDLTNGLYLFLYRI